MPKLLQINATANWGSTGRIAEQIGLAAMASGWESCIAYGRYANTSESQTIKIGSYPGVIEHYLENRLIDNEGLASRSATRELIAEIKNWSPDIIHLHNIHDHYVNYEILFDYLNSNDIPVVWTFHDCWAFTGHCHYFDSVDCERWKTNCFDCPLNRDLLDRSSRNYQKKAMLFKSCGNLTIVPVSDWLGSLVKESFLKEKPISVIHNGIDLKVFSPQLSNSKSRYRILGVSNVWDERKGLRDFILLRQILSDECEIVLLGLNKQQIKRLPDSITGIERTTSLNKLIELYSSADVLVNPTYADTFPTVNLEALACGTPVITYKTGGSPEAIDVETGIVVKQGDVRGLAEAVLRLKEQPLSREACRARAERLFDKDKCFEKYISLYESLLADKN